MNDLIYLEELTFMIAFIAYLFAALSFILMVAFKKNIFEKVGIISTVLGFIIHSIAIILRVIESNRLPFSNQYEFATSFSWGIVLCFIVIYFIYKYSATGAFVMPVAFIVMGYASVLPKEIKPLMPALQSGWLYVHVGTAVLSYGAFAVAAGLSVMYLVTERRKKEHIDVSKLPDSKVCDYLSYRVIAFGYIMLTLVIITGAIWAKAAWSRYWGWDPKETWSLITWLIYSAYLHLRLNRGWRGRQAALFAIIGFICVIFTFIGVNILIPGIHSYYG